jgi:hypothetical protein
LWRNNKRYGIGQLIKNNGDLYEGEWKNDIPYGKGIYKSKNNDVYEGDWIDGKK